MPPKQSSGHGRPAAGAHKSGTAFKTAANSGKRAAGKTNAASSNSRKSGANKKQKAITLSDDENDTSRRQAPPEEEEEGQPEEDEEEDERESIPPELLSRIVHELFEHKDTKITKDANNALSGYMDVFVREAIARAAVERRGGFLEVEDLEKIAPQLVLDL